MTGGLRGGFMGVIWGNSPGIVQELLGLDSKVLDLTADIVDRGMHGLVLLGGFFGVDLGGTGRLDDVGANLAAGTVASGNGSSRGGAADNLAHGAFLGGT